MSSAAAPRSVFGDRVRAVVITIAVLSLVASIGAMVFGRQLTSPPAQPRDSYGHGALGHRAFLETMRALGVSAERWTLPTHDGITSPLFVIEPNAPQVVVDGVAHTLGELIDLRRNEGRVTVVVLPKWQPAMLGMVEPEDFGDVDAVLAELPIPLVLARAGSTERATISATDDAATPTTRSLELRWPQRVTGGIAVLSDAEGSFVVRDPKSLVFVVSDADLLHNASLQRADHAAYWADFVRVRLAADAIVIDEVFHDSIVTRSLAELFASWPGALALVHVGLIAIVILLMGRRRFGPPASAPEPLGRGPREVIDVAASVLVNGTRVPRLAMRYVEDLVGDLHRRLGLSEAKTLERRAELVDEAASRRRIPPRAVALLQQARTLEPTRRADDALANARAAATFRAQLIAPRTTITKPVPSNEEHR